MSQEVNPFDELLKMMSERFKGYQDAFTSLLSFSDSATQDGRPAGLPEAMFERLRKTDPERLSRMVDSLRREYLDDFKAMGPDAFHLDVKPLAEAWRKVMAGEDDEQAAKILSRFLDAMAVKARLGAEYYADPEQTPVGQTPRQLVHREGEIELYRYLPLPDVKPAAAEPVLLVYSLINRSFILDLLPGASFIEYLLEQGLDVYLIEWGECAPGDRETTLDSLIEPGISGCVEAICARTAARQVSLFGHCIGGDLALMYAALQPERVARFVALTTPVTASDGGVVALWTDRDVIPIDEIIERHGHMPAKLIRYTFMALKPYYEGLKGKMFFENLGDDKFMELFYPVDRWANENVDIPGEVFRKFVREVLVDDRFSRGETRIHDRRVDLGKIRCPLFTLAAAKDWIVRPKSAEILNDLVGSKDKRFELIEDSHVGIMINPTNRKHWDSIAGFLKGSTEVRRAYCRPGLRSQPVQL
ncbi:MAG: alpha/beta fold hydrolase [Deltaproteobacteria bacterium]|nr:alpha/beta fold hydrolase [Deltaproteobacteria bacterium]